MPQTDSHEDYAQTGQLMVSRVYVRNIVSLQDVSSAVACAGSIAPPVLKKEILFDPSVDTEGLRKVWDEGFDIYAKRKLPTTIRVWIIQDCIVLPSEMMLLTTSGDLIAESVRKKAIGERNPITSHLYKNNATEPTVPLDFEEVQESVFILSASQHLNYFHWMIESLPRIYFDQIEGWDKFIIPNILYEFHKESLRSIGISSNKLLPINKPTKFSRVVFVENMAISNVRLSPIIEKFYRGKNWCRSNDSLKLYVSRRDAKTRRVVEEERFEDKIVQAGFTIMIPSQCTFYDQVRYFSSAKIIVGMHGAGLANLAFCEPDTKIIEIIPDCFREGYTCYAALSELFGLRYTLSISQSENPDDGASGNAVISEDWFQYLLNYYQ